ncbi:hypothetical protein D910_04243 [Dendroctonus ponderosae]|uniref:Uncharacterized protein n=2 Tax=Dendroctonus ponderosae TaxID=77166 RepID=U4UA77_DENPD|nr:hypothetical protein D910_04243 [Dendroctonus ponderosae]
MTAKLFIAIFVGLLTIASLQLSTAAPRPSKTELFEKNIADYLRHNKEALKELKQLGFDDHASLGRVKRQSTVEIDTNDAEIEEEKPGFFDRAAKFVVELLQRFLRWYVDSACERSLSMMAAEDICWSNKVKIVDRIQYTTKSVLNFAKEKLGLVKDEPFHPQQCDYYECIFAELKMLDPNGYPNYNKIVEWIDNNIIYNYAKTQYDTLKECNAALSQSVESDTYFSGDLIPINEGPQSLQNNCEVVREFMKCLALNATECIIFVYP